MRAIEKINDIFSLKRFVPLNELDHDKLLELIENSSVLQFKKAQPLFSGIEKNQSVFLLSGNVVRDPNSDRARLIEAGGSQAFQAIMTPDDRPRIVAGNNVTVLCVDAELLDFLLNWGGDEGFVVDEINTDEKNEWADGLLKSETILSLSPQSMQTLMSVVEPIEINANEVVFSQGDEPDYYYIVSRGCCVVMRQADDQGAPTELARLGPGDAFGEEALIANSVRSATVRMIENGLLLRLDQQNFKTLLEQSLVNTINVERANSLKASGAVVLDLRSKAAFSIDGNGINIPFAELRSHIVSLDKDKKYIVVSDDNNVSAVGAFLLSKKHFKVYLLKTESKEEIVAKSAAMSVQAGALEDRVLKLQQQLKEVNTRLQTEEKNHAASKARIQSLELSSKETEDSARKAILEASALKAKSESFFRTRVNALTSELEQEKQIGRDLSVENEKFKKDLESMRGKIEQIQSQAESRLAELNEAQGREAELGDEIKQLQQNLEELQQIHAEVLSEKQLLASQLNEDSQKSKHQSDELSDLQEKLQDASAQAEGLGHELQGLQVRYAELEKSLEQSLVENQSLNNELSEASQKAAQQSAELDGLRDQLRSASDRAEQAERGLQASQEHLAELENSLEQSQQVGLTSEQHLGKQESVQAELEKKIEKLNEDLYIQAQVAQQQQNAMQQQIEASDAAHEAKISRFLQAESGYKQRIDQLEAELKTAAIEAKQASKQKLRNQVLSEQLSRLQGENVHSSVMLKTLLFISLLFVVGLATAQYMRVDLYDKASVMLEKVAPQINGLIDAIPEQLKPGS